MFRSTGGSAALALSGLGATPAQIQAYQSSPAGMAQSNESFAQFAAKYGFTVQYTQPTSTCNASGSFGSTSDCGAGPTPNAQFQGPASNGQMMWLIPPANMSNTFAMNYLGETVLPAWEAAGLGPSAQLNAACGPFGSLLGVAGCPNPELGAIPEMMLLGGVGLFVLLLLMKN